MNSISQTLARISRIPARIRRDALLFGTLENWREAWAAEWRRVPLQEIRLRNGVILRAPETIDLAFLFHETWVRQVYNPRGYEIRNGNTVIDIGANVGVFGAYAASRGPGVKVFAYEPFPENVKWLRRNVEDSGLKNVEIRAQAVASVSGARTLHVDPEKWIMHHLMSDSSEESGISVDCTTLDEIMSTEQIARCDLLKLDCEGSEYEILQSARPETLNRIRRMVGEYHEGPHIASSGKELCEFLTSKSFRIDRFEALDGDSGIICATNTNI